MMLYPEYSSEGAQQWHVDDIYYVYIKLMVTTVVLLHVI